MGNASGCGRRCVPIATSNSRARRCIHPAAARSAGARTSRDRGSSSQSYEFLVLSSSHISTIALVGAFIGACLASSRGKPLRESRSEPLSGKRDTEPDSPITLPESAPPARCWARMVVRSRSANVPNNDGNGTSVRRQLLCVTEAPLRICDVGKNLKLRT